MSDDDLVKKIEKLEYTINEAFSRIVYLQKSYDELKEMYNQFSIADDSFSHIILQRIDVLKGKIQRVIGNVDETLFSADMIVVESIEQQLLNSNKISKNQFRQLNDINVRYSK